MLCMQAMRPERLELGHSSRIRLHLLLANVAGNDTADFIVAG